MANSGKSRFPEALPFFFLAAIYPAGNASSSRRWTRLIDRNQLAIQSASNLMAREAAALARRRVSGAQPIEWRARWLWRCSGTSFPLSRPTGMTDRMRPVRLLRTGVYDLGWLAESLILIKTNVCDVLEPMLRRDGFTVLNDGVSGETIDVREFPAGLRKLSAAEIEDCPCTRTR
jgi:hypothetical protein